MRSVQSHSFTGVMCVCLFCRSISDPVFCEQIIVLIIIQLINTVTDLSQSLHMCIVLVCAK